MRGHYTCRPDFLKKSNRQQHARSLYGSDSSFVFELTYRLAGIGQLPDESQASNWSCHVTQFTPTY